jgi:hypothetical protein
MENITPLLKSGELNRFRQRDSLLHFFRDFKQNFYYHTNPQAGPDGHLQPEVPAKNRIHHSTDLVYDTNEPDLIVPSNA